MGMAQRIRHLQGFPAKLKGSLDIAAAKKSQREQRPAMHQRVLPEPIGVGRISLGRVEVDRKLQFRLGGGGFALTEEQHAA